MWLDCKHNSFGKHKIFNTYAQRFNNKSSDNSFNCY